jgi:hypothetical protein
MDNEEDRTHPIAIITYSFAEQLHFSISASVCPVGAVPTPTSAVPNCAEHSDTGPVSMHPNK